MPRPSWKIEIWCKDKAVARFEAPAHKLSKGALFAFLTALVVRYRTDTPQEMLLFYVNKRSGSPVRLPGAAIQSAWTQDEGEQGYICGDWECRATAMQELDAARAKWVRAQVEKTKSSGRV
jgi:hypothetical protein